MRWDSLRLGYWKGGTEAMHDSLQKNQNALFNEISLLQTRMKNQEIENTNDVITTAARILGYKSETCPTGNGTIMEKRIQGLQDT